MSSSEFCKILKNIFLQNTSGRLPRTRAPIDNPIQDGEDQKAPPSPPTSTSFSSVISANVGIWSQNFLTFSFYSFATLAQSFKAIPSASHKLLNLNQQHPSSWSYNTFSHRNATVSKLCSQDHIYNSYVIKFCWWRHRQTFWLHNL